jgi:signal transduction histidine kinase
MLSSTRSVRSAQAARRADRDARARRHIWIVDVGVATAVAGVEILAAYALSAHLNRSVTAVGVLLLCAGSGALVFRRRFPLWTLAATYATTFTYLASQPSPTAGPSWFAVIVAFGTAIYMRKRVGAIAFLAACYVGFLWGPMVAGKPGPSAVFALGLAVGLGTLLAVSEGVRLQRERAAAVARSREEEARRLVSEERLRIAREFHDVVAHNISVINVQANTALHLMDRQPERAREALTTINEVSKHALVELRSVLGVLRRVDEVDEAAPRAPLPSVATLDDLIVKAKAAGLDVRLEEEGEVRSLPPQVDLVAYRIVQESLTNSVRHSPRSSAVVRLCYEDGGVRVEVDDCYPDAVPRPAQANGANGANGARGANGANGSGTGIIGMTERARALGGHLDASPQPEGGFRVRAWLPTSNSGA